jgi:hypothetical protein
MSKKAPNVETPTNKRRRLLQKIISRVLNTEETIKYILEECFMHLLIKAEKMKSDKLDVDTLLIRLVVAETKLNIYEANIPIIIASLNEIATLELAPAKAGRPKNEDGFRIAREIYFSYFDQHKKYPTAALLSRLASKKWGTILGRSPEDVNGDGILKVRTVNDYINQFFSLNGNN